ncbi:MAG: hypothetical protein D6812_14705 [Deltaproteobacteria bacterium]|nr:MAG: hypothetical protein D6812_14705 [Deltaproteobacteria bacterium]
MITFRAGSTEGGHWWWYRLAGISFRTDREIEALSPFRSGIPTLPPLAGQMGGFSTEDVPGRGDASGPLFPSGPPMRGEHLIYRGSGFVGGRLRHVEAWEYAGGTILELGEAGRFTVSLDGTKIRLLPPEGGGELSPLVTEGLLGPALTLALARQGIWTLHASAVALDRRVLLFAGSSGVGKSTLAASLPPPWRRIADDVVPFSVAKGRVLVHPHFPQLKLPPTAQYPPDAPEDLELREIYLLAPSSGEIAIEPVSPAKGVTSLVSHTVAARLFDPPLLKRHLALCAELAVSHHVRRLRFPHDVTRLPEVAARLASAA